MLDSPVCLRKNSSTCYLLQRALSDDTIPLEVLSTALNCPMARAVRLKLSASGRDSSIGSMIQLFHRSKSGCHSYLGF